jgi:hypothetical protein
MYFVTILIIFLIIAYYVKHGRKFLSLDRIAEPVFVVNVLYLINFPVRVILRMFFGDALESAPTLVWDIDTCNQVLTYASVCMLVFNFSYEYFGRGRGVGATPVTSTLPTLQRIPAPAWAYFALLGAVVVYFTLTSRTNINFLYDLGINDIPQIVYAIQFAHDASITGSLIMFLLTRRPIYLLAFVFFFGSLLYYSFMLTAKYAIIAYLIIILLIWRRFGFAIRLRHLGGTLLVVALIFISSYTVRQYDLGAISPDKTLAKRIMLIQSQMKQSSLNEALNNLFLLKMTDRFVYLETFMVYLQALSQNVTLDLYDKLGSLPTYKMAIPSIFGVDKSGIQNIHVWFGNKYWYGLSYDYWGVIIPFGRITESFMILGWTGFLLFIFYGWLFAWLYRRFFCTPDPLLVIYYCLVFYYYILVDDCLLFNFSAIVYGTVFFFGSVLILRKFERERKQQNEVATVLR